MKKLLLLLLLLIPAIANATVTPSCAFTAGSVTATATSGSPATLSDASIVAPAHFFADCKGTTSTLWPQGTGAGQTVTSTILNQGTSTIGASGGAGTILNTDYVRFDAPVGTAAGYKLNGATTIGETSIPVNTGTGVPALGSWMEIVGDPNQYLVISVTGAGPITAVGINAPGIIVVSSTAAVVGFVADFNTYKVTSALAAGTFTIGCSGAVGTCGVNAGLIYGRGWITTVNASALATHNPGAGSIYTIYSIGTSGTNWSACGGPASGAAVGNVFTGNGSNCSGTGTVQGGGYGGAVLAGTPITVLPNFGVFANLQYETNFGDPNGSLVSGKNWSSNISGNTVGTGYNASRNYATGPLAAHVFEKAGTYTINTRVTDVTGTVGQTVSATITVLDPDTSFSTTTLCVAANSLPVAGVAGCPSGAAVLNQSIFTSAMTSASTACGGGQCQRILFNRGDTFTATTGVIVSAAGPGIIGAYGSGGMSSNPIIQLTSASAHLIKVKANYWTVMDLNLQAMSALNLAYGLHEESSNGVLFLRDLITGFYYDIDVAPAASDMSGIGVVDCSLRDVTAYVGNAPYGAFISSVVNSSFMGNYVWTAATAGTTGFALRMQGFNGFVVEHNTIITGDGSNSTVLMGVTIHGNGTLALPTQTQYGVISDNYMPYTSFDMVPTNSGFHESLANLIFERNFLPVSGGRCATCGGGISLEGHNISVRNNIFDKTDAHVTTNATILPNFQSQVGSAVMNNVQIYNNTVVNYTTTTGESMIALGNGTELGRVTGFGTTDIYIENNLGYAPNDSTAVMFSTKGYVPTGASGTLGNSSTAQVRATLPFTLAQPVNLIDYRIPASSYAANNSTDGAVTLFPAIFSDFLNCKDKTATNYRSGAMVPAANAVCSGAR